MKIPLLLAGTAILAFSRAAGAACVTSLDAWKNLSLPSRTGSFTVEFDATPAAGRIDGILGLSRNAASGYTALAAIVRFNSSGLIDARNGGAYGAASSIPYSGGLTYRFRLAVNLTARTYTAYVTPSGGSERLIGANYAFRNEQRTVSSLANLAAYATGGAVTACTVTADTAPPLITGVSASGIGTSSATLAWTTNEPADSSAEYGTTTGYGATTLDATLVTSHRASLPGLLPGTLYHYRVRSKDAAGNAAASGDFTFTTASPPPAPGCRSVAAAWSSLPFAAQTGAFTVEFDATPEAAGMDGVLGLSRGAATGYASLAAIVRFNSSGFIDARNGSAYSAAAQVPYAPRTSYRFRLTVDLSRRVYTAYVRAASGAEQLLGASYAFRSEQATATSLDALGAYASSGSELVCAPAVSAPGDATAPTIRITSPSAGAVVASATPVSADSSDDVGVAGVQFLLDGSPLGPEDTSAPYETSWDTTASPDGSHALSAVARDASGKRTTAAAVSVTVRNSGSTRSAYDSLVLDDRPILFLAMDTPGSLAQADLSGRGHDGTYLGGTPSLATLPNGDRAASFNGSSQYLTVPSATELSVPASGVLTIESWIRPSTLQFPNSEAEDYVYFLGKGNPSDGYEYANRMYSLSNSANRPNRISVYSWNTTGGLGSGAYFQDPVSTSQWIHVTDVINMRDRSTAYPTGYIAIYKNGVLRGKVRLDQYDVTPGTTRAPFNVGTRNRNSWFQGAIGKVAIYDYVLSDAQIQRHYSTMASGAATASTQEPAPVSEAFLAPQRFLSPALADGINDEAVFGPRAAEVTILDNHGRTLYHARREGAAALVWRCRDAGGRLVDSGIYVACIRKADGDVAFQSFAVVK